MLEILLFLGGLALTVRIGQDWTRTSNVLDHAEKVQQDAADLIKQLKG